MVARFCRVIHFFLSDPIDTCVFFDLEDGFYFIVFNIRFLVLEM